MPKIKRFASYLIIGVLFYFLFIAFFGATLQALSVNMPAKTLGLHLFLTGPTVALSWPYWLKVINWVTGNHLI